MCEDGRNAFKIIFGIVWVFQYSLDGTACLGVPGIALFGLKTYGLAYRGFIWPVAVALAMYVMLHGTAYRKFIWPVSVALAFAHVYNVARCGIPIIYLAGCGGLSDCACKISISEPARVR
ncbi:hypothetical protein DPMN_052094 [Dreissena polymorpha]|uniref:Uncharacterized protein n=1 Tax=Dreissena polymorpha TaxID=45954 RepID=A0A9D4HPI4_DREPO|nr:hypothetical protein DPMN_052094 [Dreissena polymorpha]